MRTTLAALAAVTLTPGAYAQAPGGAEGPPPGLAVVEIERSRECVEILARVEELDAELAPLAERAQRLVAIAQAVALEDERVMDSLDPEDPVEAQVRDWFERDQELARRYVATLAQSLVDQRSQAREAIKTVVSDALAAVQEEANAKIGATGDLAVRSGPCDGAIFVRGAVLEACTTASGSICDAAGSPPGTSSRFRFVEEAEAVWDIQQMRPWTDPGPLRVGANGQLDGARTIALSRTGNVVVSVAFSPILRDRAEMTSDQIAAFEAANQALGIQFSHPELAFTPGLGIRATLPIPLGGESGYALHFGPPEEADVVWTGEAGSGAPLEAAVRLTPAHVGRLRAGDPLTFTALPPATGGEAPVFTIGLAAVNQTRASSALLGYMSQQFEEDLTRLVGPRGS